MADTTRREQGRAMRRKLMGDAFAAKVDKAVYSDPIMQKFAEVTQETIFGALWTRPGPLPTRPTWLPYSPRTADSTPPTVSMSASSSPKPRPI